MKKLTLVLFLIGMFSVSAHAGTDNQNALSKKSSNGEVKDCFERVNRGIFAFNQSLDEAVFEPLARGYRKLPSPVKTGTSNFLSNISNLISIPNNILQGDLKNAGVNSGRLILNTTIGILGIFDPATSMGLKNPGKEDFGQTFGSWGVGEGCYLVLPVLGPSTVRDTVGSVLAISGGDPWHNITVRNDTHYFTDFDYWMSRGTSGIDFRAKNIESFQNLEENSMDFYASVRSLYLQDRKQKILNSKKITETQNDSDWEEIENK